MKVHLYGNILNNSYNLTTFLRNKGIDAEMFLDDSSGSKQDYPWWEDTHLSENNLPTWIHYYKLKPNFIFPQQELKAMIRDFADCDIALVCGWGPIIAQRAKVPYLFFSFGSDLNITAFRENLVGLLRKMVQLKKPAGLLSLFLFNRVQTKAIKAADKIGILMGYQINTYVKKLGVLHKMKRLRLAWDIEKYNSKRDPALEAKYQKFESVYFMIARHTWKSVWNDFKGNDKFIRAYARFINSKNPNVILVLINKGPDVELSKKLISDLGIEDRVEWVNEMNKDGIRGYNAMEKVVVVDQFWSDRWFIRYPEDRDRPRMGFGSGSIEALSAERPLITAFFDHDFYNNEQPPILDAFTEDEIYQRLVDSLEMGKEGRMALGRKGYEFVKKYHGWENTTDLYINTLKEILIERKQLSTFGDHAERTS